MKKTAARPLPRFHPAPVGRGTACRTDSRRTGRRSDHAQEWFRLEACYPEIRDELSPFVRLLCEASLGSHFNRLPESCNAIGTLLNDYQQELFADPEGSMLGWLLSMLIGNLQELGAYEQAADLLTQFAAGQSEEERASTW